MYEISQVFNQVLNEAQRIKPKNTSLKTMAAAVPFTAEDYRQFLEMPGSKDVAQFCIMENHVKPILAQHMEEEAAAKVLYLKASHKILRLCITDKLWITEEENDYYTPPWFF